MVALKINGEEAPVKTDTCSQLMEIIELIKTVIDPDHMITGILLNGEPLDDNDWNAPVSQLGTSIVEISTDLPDIFVGERLARASEIVKSCYYEFREARQQFQEGKSVEANRQLVAAVQALQAFFEWYGTLLELIPEERRKEYDITSCVQELSETCKGICQQQLYQSWWALGESIQQKLEPQLDNLEGRCRQFQNVSYSTQ